MPRAAVSANVAAFAADQAPVLAEIQANEHPTPRAIAAALTVRGIGMQRGGNLALGMSAAD